MERHIRIAGWLWIGYGAIAAAASSVLIFIFLFMVDDGDKTAGEFLFLALASLILILGGVGLLKRLRWARYLMLVLALIHLPFPPIQTALSLYTLFVLLRRDTKDLFRSKPDA